MAHDWSRDALTLSTATVPKQKMAIKCFWKFSLSATEILKNAATVQSIKKRTFKKCFSNQN